MKQETPKQHVELINDNIEEFDKAIKLFKQETLEEAAENYSGYEEHRMDFIEGAKWQQERSYSEEDMRTAWNSSEQNMRFNFSSSFYKNITFEQWFKQFKKK